MNQVYDIPIATPETGRYPGVIQRYSTLILFTKHRDLQFKYIQTYGNYYDQKQLVPSGI